MGDWMQLNGAIEESIFRTNQRDKRSCNGRHYQAARRFVCRASLLLLSIFIAAQPLCGAGSTGEAGSINDSPSTLLARANSLVPLGFGLQSVRPCVSQRASMVCPRKRAFLHVSSTPIVSVEERRCVLNVECVDYTPVLGFSRSVRSPPFTIS